MIKPGSVCYLVSLPNLSQYNGRVVTVVGPSIYNDGLIAFTAPWVVEVLRREDCLEAATLPRCLLPINDPDEPVTTRTPEELTA